MRFFKTINPSYKSFTARLYIHNYELFADMEKIIALFSGRI